MNQTMDIKYVLFRNLGIGFTIAYILTIFANIWGILDSYIAMFFFGSYFYLVFSTKPVTRRDNTVLDPMYIHFFRGIQRNRYSYFALLGFLISGIVLAINLILVPNQFNGLIIAITWCVNIFYIHKLIVNKNKYLLSNLIIDFISPIDTSIDLEKLESFIQNFTSDFYANYELNTIESVVESGSEKFTDIFGEQNSEIFINILQYSILSFEVQKKVDIADLLRSNE